MKLYFKILIVILLLFLTYVIISAQNYYFPAKLINDEIKEKPFGHKQLSIPPLLDSKYLNNSIELNIVKSQKEFYNGVRSDTFAYNGNFLGPTILAYDGQDLKMTYNNYLGEETTVHKHGLHIPGNVDGGPQNKILHNVSKSEVLEIRQEASTNWYHPHIMGKTSTEVYKGLAGMFIIKDNLSENLGLPNIYGIDDIPLVVQDRMFVNGKMDYDSGFDGEIFLGDTVIINGDINPELKVPKQLIRLRLLNGANSRIFTFRFSDNREFSKIATDGGFLDEAVKLNTMIMSPGERNEILVDFSDGEEAFLVTGNNPRLFFEDSFENSGLNEYTKILKISVDETLDVKNYKVKKKLNEILFYNSAKVLKTRVFNLSSSGHDPNGMMTINGVSMDMNVINERVKLGELEKWVVNSEDSTSHPFHIHGTSFQIISQDGKETALEDRGWKDTVLVRDNVELLVKFKHKATKKYPYMYHCHMLEHEDMGMMGQFIVE